MARRDVTPAERTEYRAAKRAESRELIETAARQLLTSEGWRRYAEVRAAFHRYSPNNCMLIAMQRPDATRVAGFRKWQELGRQVRKGERAIRILAPHTGTRIDSETGEETFVYFRAVPVFDVARRTGSRCPRRQASRLLATLTRRSCQSSSASRSRSAGRSRRARRETRTVTRRPASSGSGCRVA
jgi:hypothetical protein